MRWVGGLCVTSTAKGCVSDERTGPLQKDSLRFCVFVGALALEETIVKLCCVTLDEGISLQLLCLTCFSNSRCHFGAAELY